MRLPPLPSIGDIIRLYKLSALKKLSQNFIMDMKMNEKIVREAGDLTGCCVCEVGPGPGGITRAILNAGVEHLYVIEKDKRFFPGLQMLADASGCLTAYHGDVLRFDMENLFPEEYVKEWTDVPPKLHIIGNLPFSVATPLIFQYVENVANKSDAWRYGRVKMTLTFQKEVGFRMVAQENDEFRCRVSPVIQNWCHANIKMLIPGQAFVPSPDVDVALVHLVPRKEPVIDLPYKLVVRVTSFLFHHRQKICRNNLKYLFPPDEQDLLTELLETADIASDKRPIAFTMEDISRLCHAYDRIVTRLPYLANFDYRNPSTFKKLSEIRKFETEMGLRDPGLLDNAGEKLEYEKDEVVS